MNKGLITSKPIESRSLVISNLPETATEEIIKEYFERYGHVQSVKIDDQHFAFVTFLDIRTASKVHHTENILDQQQLRTTFYDGSNSISKILRETSPVTSSIIEPSSSSPSSITTVTNTLMDKTITTIHENRDKHTTYSPQENTRHQVVPIKHDSDLSGNKRKISSTQRKRESSSSSSSSSSLSERSHKYRHQHTLKSKHQSSKTKILKVYHLPLKMSSQSLRETLRNIFIDFKKPSHLLKIKIIDDYALLTFKKYEDVEKALLFIITKSINGIRLKAELYNENDEYDLMKRSICSDLDIDEYSPKATRTLYIGNLQPEITYHQLREIYSVYGEIIEIEIKRQQSQHSFAFIQYSDIKSVVKALKSKVIHDHSIKLGFGKSQPTNVLWLDDLPSNITELMLRTFLNRLTNLSSNEILDIYIDNRNSQKNEFVQCLIYFTDIITAQNAINLIRGKKFETKRIQVDFASRIFLTKFSDIIQQTIRSDRRYSKISDTGSSITRNRIHHHSSSSSNHSSINHKKLIKSDTDKHANTSRIFDWLMQNHHSNINHDDEEEHSEQHLSNLKLIENKKKNFQTRIIPLQADSLFIQSDIRLKVYSSLYIQSINSIRLPLPQFAKKSIINSKTNLKISIKKEDFHNDDLLIKKEIDQRIKLLDKQIYDINQNQNLQISSLLTTHTAEMKYNPMLSTTNVLHPPVPSSLIPPSPSNKNLSNILSMKFKRKPIPPPLSVIPTLPIPSNTNDSPIFSTPKSMTPSSTLGNKNHSPTSSTFSPLSQKQIINNSPKPTVLKSILKQSSNPSQSTSNEIRKAVHIISTNPTIKQTLPSNDNKKPIMNKNQTDTKKSLKIIKITKVAPSLSKLPHQLNKIPKLNIKNTVLNKKSSSLKPVQQNKKSSISTIKKSEEKLITNSNKILKKKLSLQQNTCMYDRIKERSRNTIINSSKLEIKKSIIFDSEIFDTEENDHQKQKIITKFNKKDFILKKKSNIKSQLQKRQLIDEGDKSSKKIKLQSKINEEQIENVISSKIDTIVSSIKISKNDDQPMNSKDETMKLDDSIDSKPSTNKIQQEIPNEKSSQILTDKSILDEPLEKTLNIANPSIDHQVMITDKSIPITPSEMTKPSNIPSSTPNEPLNQFDSRSITTHKHSSTPIHIFPQILTPDNNVFTPHHQHFPYPFFAPDSPPSSTRTLSTSSCSSIIGNPFYNTIIPGQQHCHDKESSRRDSFTKSQYLGSSIDSLSPFRNPSELYGYPSTAQQMLNTIATEYYRMNDIQSCDPYDIQWDGYIILKTDQAYIKTQLIAGNSQIARIAINYWNSDLNHNLRISQRMRLDEIQLDGVKKHMQMINDHCILIAEPNGLTPDEIRLEQNHLKNGVIQYLNEKKAAGILNILLPGVLQPVYVVHIFPPCQFASEILQKRAPDAYRCVVQNKIEQIYLLFIITSTI